MADLINILKKLQWRKCNVVRYNFLSIFDGLLIDWHINIWHSVVTYYKILFYLDIIAFSIFSTMDFLYSALC